MAANILTTYSPHNVQGRPEQLATQGYLFSLDHVATISSPAPLVNEGGGLHTTPYQILYDCHSNTDVTTNGRHLLLARYVHDGRLAIINSACVEELLEGDSDDGFTYEEVRIYYKLVYP